MSETAGDVMCDVLIDWGVDTIFGMPGDGINGVFEAMRKRKDKLKFIQVRHEEGAAFAACGYAKYTGKLGVCVATSGPGGIHLLNGLYDAKMDGQPVLAITGNHFHDLLDLHSQQDIDLDKVFQDVAVYSARIMGPAHVERVTELAIRKAVTYRQVAHLNFPVDFQSEKVSKDVRSKRNLKEPINLTWASYGGQPCEDDLRKAAEVLNAGKKIAILAGRGAIGCGDELAAVAEKLGAPVIKALLGKAALPDNSPYSAGGIGLLGTRPAQDAMEGCDTLFIVGSSFPYMEFLPRPGEARGVQIDADPARIGLRYPVEVGLAGDAKRTLQLLLPMLKRNESRDFLQTAQKGMKEWRGLLEERGTRRDTPMKPQVVGYELNKILPPNAIISTDSGTITTWAARYLHLGPDNMFSCSGTLASMACGLPYAVGAAVAHPGRPVIAIIGDGGFTMLMSEWATACKYNLNIKAIVIKNNTLGQIKWEQMIFLGNPEYGVSLHPIDFAAVARAFGGTGITIEDPARCGEQLQQALATPGPVLIEAVVDPFEPPMPPKITAGQAVKFAESLARGEPNATKIALTVTEDKVRELV